MKQRFVYKTKCWNIEWQRPYVPTTKIDEDAWFQGDPNHQYRDRTVHGLDQLLPKEKDSEINAGAPKQSCEGRNKLGQYGI